jgi:Redoxin/Copper type II ascorbate-dependent monooxygenase, C-terminal domain
MLSKSAKHHERHWIALLSLTALATLAVATVASSRGEAQTPVDVREVRGVDGRAIPLVPSTGGAIAVVFYSTECPISNEYSPILRAIADGQPSGRFSMVGVCVDPDLSADDVAKHAKEYGLKFPIALDRDGSIAGRFGAKVTPEAFVLDDTGTVRYRGRVDDTYAARGKRKANPETSELKDAVAAILTGKDVAVDHVEAIGCPIPKPIKATLKPTFSKEVAPILQKNCQQCHRPGQVGPFSLVTYDQARKRADDISNVVVDRRMPPWKPDPKVGPAFKHSKALSDDEIALIAAWAEAGAPEGDKADLPAPPTYRDGWALGDPDLILEASEDFAIPAEGADIYRCFVIPTNLPQDKYIAAIEYQPGNRKVVHHVLTYVDTSGKARKLDEADAGLGYSCFSGPGVEVTGDLGGWAPGNEPSFLPEGVGRILPSKADVVMQVHYHPSGKAETDRTRIGVYFATKPVKQILHWNAAIKFDLSIPPQSKNFEAEVGWKDPRFGWKVPVDVTALAVTPHMHMLGRDMTMTVTYPDGRNEDLIRIGDWDFNWQNTYYFEKPIDLPKGSVLKVRAHYDNPTQKPVKWGEATTDEMCIGFLAVVQKGQDLTRPGEKDQLGDIFKEQVEERKEAGRKMKEAAEKKKAEAAKSKDK